MSAHRPKPGLDATPTHHSTRLRGAEPGERTTDRTRTVDPDPHHRPTAALLVGEHVGRYLLTAQRGRGAMGTVYEAWDETLKRRVAIKVMRSSRASWARRAQGARREARAMALLSHPNVVPVYDTGIHGDQAYVVMELVDAVDLATWLREPRAMDRRHRVLKSAGRGLAAAHQHGLVHRDIKPANVLVAADDIALVTDFGLAIGAVLDEPEPAAGRGAGTPAYMAPEQHEGRTIDTRADQYAFCVMAWEVLVGQRPFSAFEGLELIAAKKAGPPALQRHRGVSGRGVSGRTLLALTRGLDPNPERRWPDMDSLLAALFPSRARWPAIAMALGLGAVLGVGVWTRDDPCRDDHDLDDAWSPTVRTQTAAAIRDHLGPERADDVVAFVDQRVHEWSEAHLQACTARTPVAQRRRHCLLGKHRDLATRIETLRSSPQTAVLALPSFPRPAACEEQIPDSEEDLDPTIAAQLDEAMMQGWQARAQGDLDRAAHLLTGVIERARALGYRHQLAAALTRLGSVQELQGHAPDAMASLQEALAIAEEVGHGRAAAEAWIEILWIQTVLGQLGDAEHSARAAEHAIARMGGSDDLESARLTNLANLQITQGRHHDAVLTLQAARELRAHEASNRWAAASTVASIDYNLSVLALIRGDDQVMLEHLKSAHALLLEAFGPGHPDLARQEVDMALALDRLEEYEAAELQAAEARRTTERIHGSDHLLLSEIDQLEAFAAERAGDLDGAIRLLETAIERLRRHDVEDDEAMWQYWTNIGIIQLNAGRVAQAREISDRTKAAVGYLDPPSRQAFSAFELSAMVALDEGRVEDARADLERALERAEATFPAGSQHYREALTKAAGHMERAEAPARAAELQAKLDELPQTE